MGNKVLVVGSGGREHALGHYLAQSTHVSRVYFATGNAGTALMEKSGYVELSPTDVRGLVRFANEAKPDLTIVGPEAPLVGAKPGEGIVDLWPDHLPIWGPTSEGALLESSKIHAKNLMDALEIPTANWAPFDSIEAGRSFLLDHDAEMGFVVKADGLCAGKGVIVCDDRHEAELAVEQMAQFGPAGSKFIIEEKLKGREVSMLVLCTQVNDGGGTQAKCVPLLASQDYKPAFPGGPNTGGMGAICPVPFGDLMTKYVIERIAEPVCNQTGFSGTLYIGLMLTEEGLKVLEFNCRFGDPETQAILPLLNEDLFVLLHNAAAHGRLPDTLNWRDQTAAISVVMASDGYPGKYQTGSEIRGLPDIAELCPGVEIFHAGTKLVDNKVVTSSGRVLNITATGPDLAEAREKAYEATDLISWDGAWCRSDIGVCTV